MSRLVKLQPRYGCHGPQWFLENDEGDLTWVSPMVKEHIERLEDENAKLRKELELAGHIAVSNVVASIGREESLEAENAKLQELTQDMGELLDMFAECDLACKHYHDGCIGDCYYVNARRDLGIEVDG